MIARRFRISPAEGIVAVLMLAHAALAWAGRQIGVRTGQDDAWYVLLARALRDFRYVDLHVVGEPAHQLYPPGFPGALAIWSAIGGENIDWLIAFSVLCSMAAVAITFTVSRRFLSPGLAMLCTAAVAFNPRLIERAGMVMSEPLFTLSTLGALALLTTEAPTRRRLVGAGALAVLAALTRTVGVVVIAAVALHWLLERRWRAVAILAFVSACTIGGWLAWTAVAPEQFVGKSYIADMTIVVRRHSPLEIIGQRAVHAVLYYTGAALHATLGVPTVRGTAVDNVIIGVVLIAGLAAGFGPLLRRWRAAALFLLGYAALLIYWPWRLERYLIPLTPLIIPMALLGLVGLGKTLRRPAWGVTVGAAFIAAIALTGLWKSSSMALAGLRCDRTVEPHLQECQLPEQRSFFEALVYIKRHLPEDAVVATVKSAPFYYYTGRRTPVVGVLTARADSSLLPNLRRRGAGFIFLARLHVSEPERVAPRVLANCDLLELEAELPGQTYLFRVREDGEARPNRDACHAARAYQASTLEREPLVSRRR